MWYAERRGPTIEQDQFDRTEEVGSKWDHAVSSRTVVGDVFEVSLGEDAVGFFQYLCRDSSQLNSHVVRVFKRRCSKNGLRDVSQIALGEIGFHAHVFLSVGVKQHFWRKISRAEVQGRVDVVFRNSSDYGNSKEPVSNDWFVWRIDEPYVEVGALPKVYRDAEIGVVVPPNSLVYRMNHGVYDFYYPEPE